MPHAHACVWIDHRQARILSFDRDSAEVETLLETHRPAHVHRKADHVHKGKEPPDTAFLDALAGHLGAFRGFLIAGPGVARDELASHLEQHYPVIAKNIWGVEPMEQLSDAQVLAAARKYMRKEEQLRP